jgi:hypothetical protein
MIIPRRKRVVAVPDEIRRASLIAVPIALFGGNAALADTDFTKFSFAATGARANRTMPDRLSDIFNVKDYGAKGDSSSDDTAAINAAIQAMYTKGGGVFFPPGHYIVRSQINLAGRAATTGRIAGAGASATIIEGRGGDPSILNDFVFNLDENNHNGVQEIADLAIWNSNTRIGSGALRFCQPGAVLRNVYLKGMIALDMGWNCFNQTCIGITTQSTAGQAFGSIGILNSGASVIGWGTSGGHWIGMTAVGAQACSCRFASVEEVPIGWYLGLLVGFATQCTIANNVLTVGGNLYPGSNATAPYGAFGSGGPFGLGAQIIGDGIPQSAYVTIASNGTGSGGAGTYNLSGASGITISTPQAMMVLSFWGVAGFSLSDFHTEGCGIAVVVGNVGGGKISSGNITSVANQAAAPIGANLAGGGSNSTSPTAGIVIYSGSDLTFDSLHIDTHCAQANVQISSQAILKNVTFISCHAADGGFAQTDSRAFIDDGSGNGTYTGNNGHILTVKSLAYGPVVIGGYLSGVSITAAGLTGSNTATIKDQVGGYGPGNGGGANHQYILTLPGGDTHVPPGSVININGGLKWGVNNQTPLSGMDPGSKALVTFINCNNPPLGMKFLDLPGQTPPAGRTNQGDGVAYQGMQHDIVDGQKSGGGTALFGDIVVGGGSQAIRVYYNGTNWTRCA